MQEIVYLTKLQLELNKKAFVYLVDCNKNYLSNLKIQQKINIAMYYQSVQMENSMYQ